MKATPKKLTAKDTTRASRSKGLRRVEKGIYQRGPVSFQVKLMAGGHKISETFDSLDEARAFVNAKRAAIALDPEARRVLEARAAARGSQTMTLRAALAKYRREVTSIKKGATTEGYRIDKILRSPLAEKSIYHITPDDIDEFLAGLRRDGNGPTAGEPLSDSSRRKYASLLSHLFSVCRKRWRMRVANPVDELELPPQGKPRKRRLEAGEEARLLESLQATRNPLVLPLVQLAIETAMRQGELLQLEWEDITLGDDYGTATLRETKNGEVRVVPLSSTARSILQTLKPLDERRGLVFPISKNSLRTAWDIACARAGIESLRFHDLRHEATSRLFEKGFGAIEAAAITGHKTMQVLKGYTHLRAEDLARKLG